MRQQQHLQAKKSQCSGVEWTTFHCGSGGKVAMTTTNGQSVSGLVALEI